MKRALVSAAASGELPNMRAAYKKGGATRSNAFEAFVVSGCVGKAAEAHMEQAGRVVEGLWHPNFQHRNCKCELSTVNFQL